MSDAGTIAAIATSPGVSAVAVIRISGPRAHDIARRCCNPHRASATPKPAQLVRSWFRDPQSADVLDDGLAAYFWAPHSFTGEDLVELHVHGGAGVVASVLALVLREGAHLAGPGEFSKRAFVNGRMDLAQAEAVADLIGAESERAAKAAAHRLAGGAGEALARMRRQLLDRLVEIEAHVDYPDEVPPPEWDFLRATVVAQSERVAGMLAGSRNARVLRDGIACAIAGPPNAGKSSLLNVLVAAERAIVSDLPGTTRDVIEDRVVVDGVVLRVMDTAGLRATRDPIEAAGVARAERAIAQAGLVITVIDGSRPLDGEALAAIERTASAHRILFANKLDVGRAGFDELRARSPVTVAAENGHAVIGGSVRWTTTIDEMRAAIARLGWGGALDGACALVANQRQIDALTRAAQSLERARATLDARHPVDLLSVDLREAVAAYGEVTGDAVTHEVLEGIFSRFCVGK